MFVLFSASDHDSIPTFANFVGVILRSVFGEVGVSSDVASLEMLHRDIGKAASRFSGLYSLKSSALKQHYPSKIARNRPHASSVRNRRRAVGEVFSFSSSPPSERYHLRPALGWRHGSGPCHPV